MTYAPFGQLKRRLYSVRVTARRTNSMNSGESSLDPEAEALPPSAPLDTVPDVAHFIRQLREREGLTQRQLAARTGLSESSIAKFERGEAPDFPLGRALLLLRALGVRLVPASKGAGPDLAAVLEEVKAGLNTGPNSR